MKRQTLFSMKIRKHFQRTDENFYQGPVVQSIVNLTTSLMTNSLKAAAIICKYIDIFAARIVKSYSHFFSKNIDVFAIFQDRNLNVALANI